MVSLHGWWVGNSFPALFRRKRASKVNFNAPLRRRASHLKNWGPQGLLFASNGMSSKKRLYFTSNWNCRRSMSAKYKYLRGFSTVTNRKLEQTRKLEQLL